MDEERTYIIEIGAYLSEARARLLGHLERTPLADGHMLLTGQIVDQSALFGILIRIRDLGIPLISVHRQEVKER